MHNHNRAVSRSHAPPSIIIDKFHHIWILEAFLSNHIVTHHTNASPTEKVTRHTCLLYSRVGLYINKSTLISQSTVINIYGEQHTYKAKVDDRRYTCLTGKRNIIISTFI